MPIVNISIIEGRSSAKKARLIKEVTQAVSRSLDAPEAAIRVLVQEYPAAHWGVAGVPKSTPSNL